MPSDKSFGIRPMSIKKMHFYWQHLATDTKSIDLPNYPYIVPFTLSYKIDFEGVLLAIYVRIMY